MGQIALSIVGITGRMGRRLLALAAQDSAFRLAGGYARHAPASPLPIPVGPAIEEALAAADVVIDFSSPEGTEALLCAALQLKKPLVIGTTGQNPEQHAKIREAARTIPLLLSPNFSAGIALCLEAISLFANALSPSHIRIIETHHAHKKDAPSGTALALAHAASLPHQIHSIRQGEVIGEHTVILEVAGEKISLTHEALSRDIFASGALRAAKFLALQDAGLYSLKDCLLKNKEAKIHDLGL